MEQQKLLDELNYHRADKTAKMLLNLGLITTVEYDKLQELNRQKFSPILADLCLSSRKCIKGARKSA